MTTDLSVCSVAFGQAGWTERQVDLLCEISGRTPGFLREIIIVDNNRDGRLATAFADHSLVRVIQIPRDEAMFAFYGHDHPAAIHAAIREATGKSVLLLDADSHPVRPDFPDYVMKQIASFDAVLAHDVRSRELSHPCFMLFRSSDDARNLDFDSGPTRSTPTRFVDVGRDVYQQLLRAGKTVRIATTNRAFAGVWGDVWDGHVYHHGSGTFRFSERHKEQVNKYSYFFERQVLGKHRYSLSGADRLYLSISSRMSSLFENVMKRFKN
jgi:hypothetical protein